MPKYCASLMISFIFKLSNITKNYINIRIGIAYGHLQWGYFDHNLRIFGIPINMASRLENVCTDNSICCDENFLNKLTDENICDFDDIKYKKLNADLKGIGLTNYYSIYMEDEQNISVFITYEKLKYTRSIAHINIY